MGDAYRGEVLSVRKHLKAFHDTRAVLAVEIARGLVAQDQPGVVCKRARDRPPRTLPARQAIDGVLCLPAQPCSGHQLHRAHFGLGTIETAGPSDRQHHIFERGELRQQEMELEHKAETLQPQPGAGVAVKVADILAVDQHGPRSVEHTSELQSLMRISYAVFCLKKKKNTVRYLIN